MFADFDRSLREMGTGDLSVGREVKRMAEAFYGRIAAYEAGLAADDAVLRPALARNLFGTTAPEPAQLAAMAEYVRGQAAALVPPGHGRAAGRRHRVRSDPPVSAAPLVRANEAVRQ